MAEKGTMQFSGGANYNLYYKITFTDTEMLEDYIGGERDGIYTQKEEVSKDEYDKFLESYPLYNMDDCFTELSYVVDNGTISGNKDAIDKINTLDIPDGIKKSLRPMPGLLTPHPTEKAQPLKILNYTLTTKNILST